MSQKSVRFTYLKNGNITKGNKMTTDKLQKVAKLVKFNLCSVDGNAFSLMGAWKEKARKAKVSPEEIKAVINECMSGDYDHLVCTLLANSK